MRGNKKLYWITTLLTVCLLLTILTGTGCSNEKENDELLTESQEGIEHVEETYEQVRDYVAIRYEGAQQIQRAETAAEKMKAEIAMLTEEYILFECDKEEAISAAKETFIKSQSMLWYGDREGLLADEMQVSEYMTALEEDYLSADNGDWYEKACKELGITFGDWLKADCAAYKLTCTRENIFNEMTLSFASDETLVDSEKAKKIDEAWTELEMQILSDYQKTDEYKDISVLLDEIR